MAAGNIVFGTYAESIDELRQVYRLAESLRQFGGRFRGSPVWSYVPDHVILEDTGLFDQLRSLDVEVHTSHTPEQARWFYYAGKVYAAARAETDAAGQAAVLVWMDEDTIVLSEPKEFDLAQSVSFAYRPVMHNRSGSLFEAPPDDFWGRIYEVLSLGDDMLFAMVTPADKQKIRAYFQAGILVVRPERGILRRWPADFERLYTDPALVKMCRESRDKRIFLHQTALVGAVLHSVSREETLELPDRYNYPIFFERQYGADEAFDSIQDVVTARCVVSSKHLGADWHSRLAGPPEKVAWLRERLGQG
ncbi:MAG TPA: hypothetical protein VMY05_01175 [Acidobacteriota bacterium]|nr:hypothetical protein [Acidobacteriota bacterium]